MRTVTVRPPSFPDAAAERPLDVAPAERWQVLCGDEGHWRAGVYSPPETGRDQLGELERHDCPELFLLLTGRVVLVCLIAGELRDVELPPGRPVLVRAPHAGYCPNGPHSGAAFVVERDAFSTEYRTADAWVIG